MPFEDNYMLHSNADNFVNTPELPEDLPPGPHLGVAPGPQTGALRQTLGPQALGGGSTLRSRGAFGAVGSFQLA